MEINEKVLKALNSIKDIGSERSIVELGWLEIISVKPPKIVVRLTLPDFAIAQRSQIANDIRMLASGPRSGIVKLTCQLMNQEVQLCLEKLIQLNVKL